MWFILRRCHSFGIHKMRVGWLQLKCKWFRRKQFVPNQNISVFFFRDWDRSLETSVRKAAFNQGSKWEPPKHKKSSQCNRRRLLNCLRWKQYRMEKQIFVRNWKKNSIQVCLILNQYSELLPREYTKRSAFQSHFHYPSGLYQILAFANTVTWCRYSSEDGQAQWNFNTQDLLPAIT